MKILVCGNRAEHEWPETCARTLQSMGHDTELCYFLWPRDGQFELYLPREVGPEVPQLLDTEAGRKALMEVVFFNLTRQFEPDLVLLTGLRDSWSADALADVKERLNVPVVLWSDGDPIDGVDGVLSRANLFDRVWLTVREIAERAADQAHNVDYLPFACDPERDTSLPASESHRLEAYRCDLGYLGTITPDRAQVLDSLAQAGLDLKVWSTRLPRNAGETHPHLASAQRSEHVQGSDKRLVYGGAKVVLNLHRPGSGNMQFFEAAACGAFQICGPDTELASALPPDLAQHVVTSQSAQELGPLAQIWLSDDAGRQRQAARLQEAVRAGHTWEQRLEQVLAASCRSLLTASADS